MRNLIEALEQIPYIKRKISSIDEITKEMPSNLVETHKQLNKKQNELDQKLFKLHEKLLETTSKTPQTQSPITTTEINLLVTTKKFLF